MNAWPLRRLALMLTARGRRQLRHIDAYPPTERHAFDWKGDPVCQH